MKKKTFKRFLSDYAKEMNHERSLSLFKNERNVQKNTRLLTVFSFYVFFNQDVTRTLLEKKDKLPALFKMYTEYRNKYQNTTYDNVEKVVSHLDDFDELKQLYTSYQNLYVNKVSLMKKLYHQKIRQTQKEKHISNYRIYTDLRINQGNANDYLKNEKYHKLSIKKIKSIHEYVTSI
jgi:hypothetical protein